MVLEPFAQREAPVVEAQADKPVGPAMGTSLMCAARCRQRWRAPAYRNVAGEGFGPNSIETKFWQVAENAAPKRSPKNGPEMVTFVYIYT